MQNKKTIHVAVVDSCEFTMIGLQSLGKREPDEKHDVIFHGFTHIEELAMSEQLFDIIIYDPLNTRHFRVTTNDDILCIGNDSNLLIVFYVQIMPDDFVMQLHRF
ncbi:hypothetical protein RY018_00310 [Enterobacter hormaechei]|uniref:hypothetical protein n=1 Tax=Enterobacter hormaechei TaxID=158836 RepID=UPI00384E5547